MAQTSRVVRDFYHSTTAAAAARPERVAADPHAVARFQIQNSYVGTGGAGSVGGSSNPKNNVLRGMYLYTVFHRGRRRFLPMVRWHLPTGPQLAGKICGSCGVGTIREAHNFLEGWASEHPSGRFSENGEAPPLQRAVQPAR